MYLLSSGYENFDKPSYVYMSTAANSLLHSFVHKLAHARPHNALHSPSKICTVYVTVPDVCTCTFVASHYLLLTTLAWKRDWLFELLSCSTPPMQILPLQVEDQTNNTSVHVNEQGLHK